VSSTLTPVTTASSVQVVGMHETVSRSPEMVMEAMACVGPPSQSREKVAPPVAFEKTQLQDAKTGKGEGEMGDEEGR
jgi:hypothetical protein